MAEQENNQQGPPRVLEMYDVNATIIKQEARTLLENYSRIPPAEVNAHVDAIREKAFAIFPYPCIGMYRFLNLGILQTGVYEDVLRRVKAGDRILDLGCCFGQEIRQLLADGAPAQNCFCSDLRQEFWDLGFDLFRDREREGGDVTFMAGNVFDEDSPLRGLDGTLSIVYTGSFFHLFSHEEQIAVAKRVVRLLKPEPGVLVCGRQVGNVNAGDYESSGLAGPKRSRFRHDVASWTELWEEVGKATGTEWQVDAKLQTLDSLSSESVRERMAEPSMGRLSFVVKRV